MARNPAWAAAVLLAVQRQTLDLMGRRAAFKASLVPMVNA